MWKWLISGLAVVLVVAVVAVGYFAWRYYSPEPPDVAGQRKPGIGRLARFREQSADRAATARQPDPPGA